MDKSELEALRTSARDMLQVECTAETVLKHFVQGGGRLAPLWSMITGLGWAALALPEAYGGLELGLEALAVLYEELGRAVAPLPFLPTMLAAQMIAAVGDTAQQATWLPRIAAGAVIAVMPPAPLAETTLHIERAAAGWIVSGDVRHVLDAADADALLLLARDQQGALWRVLAKPAALTTYLAWDHGHTLSDVSYDGLPIDAARVMPSNAHAEEALAIHAALALAAEAVGGSAAILERTVAYLKTRQQFGKPIGSFQGLKHRVADHRARLEGDTMLLRSAASLAACIDPLGASETSAAKAMACAHYAELARDCVQLHGGIGFTSEHACHLFLKRARLIEQLFGEQALHLARAAAALAPEVAS